LPELIYDQHIVAGEYDPDLAIFEKEAKTLKEQRIERKKTMTQRCEKVAELVSHNKPAVVWCQYNQEGDELEKMIPDCVQVAGCDSDEKKEERLNDFSLGKVRVIVTKPKIGAFGLNWQHCGNHCFFPSHSFEQFYQRIRRSLRFGRKGSVKADIISTPGESRVIENLKAKQIKADLMFQSLIREMNNSIKNIKTDNHIKKVEVASWV
jgi:superfamily II DNA or RNA helicase